MFSTLGPSFFEAEACVTGEVEVVTGSNSLRKNMLGMAVVPSAGVACKPLFSVITLLSCTAAHESSIRRIYCCL